LSRRTLRCALTSPNHLLRFGRSYSAFGPNVREEASKWKKYCALGLAFWGATHFVVLSLKEDEKDRKAYAHMFVLHKDFFVARWENTTVWRCSSTS